ncbi:MAG: ATP-binding protein [Bauldia sp.]
MEAVGQLTGGLAHDFNNLLAIVIGSLDLLVSRIANDEEALTLAKNALSASLRGAELTRKLLAFSRRQTLGSTAVDVNDLVRGMTALLRRSLGENIEIEMATSNELWPVDTDPTQLESALINLAINARDAMPGGGRLTIETANRHLDEQYAARFPELTAGDYVMMAVTDTGTGIPKDILGRVIEPFFTTKEVGKGSGLGLSMIFGFTKQSRGHMNIYSEEGQGTTVRLYLPRGKNEPVPADESIQQTTEWPGHGELILVVDDNDLVRQIVTTQMVELGYRALECADAASALELVEANPQINLLFTDVVMPGGMTGVQLAEAVKRVRPKLPILYTSGFTEASLTNGTLKAVAREDLLSKPYRKHELAKKLREALSRG